MLSSDAGYVLPANQKIHIFVNGIFNSLADAKGSATRLALKLGLDDRQVGVVHIEDRPPSTADITADNFWQATDQAIASFLRRIDRASLHRLRSALISITLQNIKVVVHAHSRGSLVLERALRSLAKDPSWTHIRRRLCIRTYGAVRFISPIFGRNVMNYFNKLDGIAGKGQKVLNEHNPSASALSTRIIGMFVFAANPRQPSISNWMWLEYTLNCTQAANSQDVYERVGTIHRINGSSHDPHSFQTYLNHIDRCHHQVFAQVSAEGLRQLVST